MAFPLSQRTQPISPVWATRDLRAAGWSRDAIARAVADGAIVRVRRGRFLAAGTPADVLAAAAVGGRLDCVSLLVMLGVFVHHRSDLHVQQDPLASRRPRSPHGVRYHWRPTDARRDSPVVDIVEALAQAIRCQAPRSAVATLDNAWHLGLIDEAGVDDVFARVPRRYRVLRPLLDPRSEAGTETLVRLMLRSLGCRVELQVRIDGVGRVDLLVNGWLIIECDSEQFHGTWQNHKKDRRRDLAAMERGYSTLRLLAEDILFRPEQVQTSLARIIVRGAARPNS